MSRALPAPPRAPGRRLARSLALAVTLAGCGDAAPRTADVAVAPPTASPPVGLARAGDVALAPPTASPRVGSARAGDVALAPPTANPFASLEREEVALAGRVEERLAAGSYVYLAIRGDDGARTWAVVMGAAPAVGDAITATSMGVRRGFRSGRLARDFDALHFAVLSTSP